jgi:glycosyltransferase involved in cell wall biosynthesis
MKILFLTRTTSNRGGQIILVNLIKRLRQQGYAIDFVAFKPQGAEDFPDCAPLYQNVAINVLEVDPYDEQPLQMKAFIDAAQSYLHENKDKYDKIILDSWFSALAGAVEQLPYDKTFHLVQSNPNFEPEDASVVWQSRLHSVLPLSPMQRIVVSKSMQTLFKEQYNEEYPRLDLYIDDIYRTADFTVEDRQFLRLVSSAADFNVPSKGLNFLLDQLQRVTQPFTLTLISNQPIAQDTSSYPFPIEMKHANTPQEMVSLLQQHDVYANTSVKEAFPLALAEAITLGMPTIALDSVGNRDYAHGDNFIFVKDKDDFLPELMRLFDIETRRTLHAKARPSMGHYTLDEMTEQFKAIIGL